MTHRRGQGGLGDRGYDVPLEEILRLLQQVITPVVSVPNSGRASMYRALERFRSDGRVRRDLRSPYKLHRVATRTIQLADDLWVPWPVQEEEQQDARTIPALTPEPGDCVLSPFEQSPGREGL